MLVQSFLRSLVRLFMDRPPLAISAAGGGVSGYLLALVNDFYASSSPVQAWTLAGVPTSELVFELVRRIVPQHAFIVFCGLVVIFAAFVLGAAVSCVLLRLFARGSFSSATSKVISGLEAYRLDGVRAGRA